MKNIVAVFLFFMTSMAVADGVNYRIAQGMAYLEGLYESKESAETLFSAKNFTPEFNRKLEANPELFKKYLSNFKAEKNILGVKNDNGMSSGEFGQGSPLMRLSYYLDRNKPPKTTQTYILSCPHSTVKDASCLIHDIQ